MKLTRQTNAKRLALPLAVGLLLLLASSLRASTLDDYDARLVRAITLVEAFQSAYKQSGHSRGEPTASLNVEFVRQQLPAKETINFQGQSVAVDNSWLEYELDEFEKSTKATDRHAVVVRISERLRAIQQHVQELRQAANTPRDKDAEKGRLAEILRRPEYVPAPPQGNALEQLILRILRWLEKLFPRPKPMQPGSSGLISTIAQIVVIGGCLAAIVLVIWRYGPRLMSGRRKKKKKREARIVLGETLGPDQTAADLLAQAEVLAREGNLRGAIRKAYIALLCELSDRKIISLAQYKTNRDYLNAVRDKGSLYTSMRQLTNTFELHWYGFVPAGEADWDEFRNGYRKIVRE